MADSEDSVPSRLEPEQTTSATDPSFPTTFTPRSTPAPRRIITRSRRNSEPLLELGANDVPLEQNRTDEQTTMTDTTNQTASLDNDNVPERPSTNESQSRIVITTAPIPQIPRLTSLKPEDVISFLHSFDSAKDMCTRNGGQAMVIKAYIDGGVVRELNEVYRASTSSEVRAVLDKIVEDYDVNKQEDGFIILREQLTWPKDEPTLDRAVTKYFQDIRRIMSKEDFTQNKQRMKQVVKEAIKHLPKFFNLDPTDYMNLPTLIEAGQRKFLPKEQFEAIKQQQQAKRESGQQESMLDQLEQFLRMRAWANRDLTTTKQKITSVLNVSAPVAPPPTPITQSLQQTALMAHNPSTSVTQREMVADSTPQHNQLLQAMSNFTDSLEALALRNNQQPRQGFQRRGGCYCCGDPNHSFRQCDIWNNYLKQSGQSHLIQQQLPRQQPFRQFPRQQQPVRNFTQDQGLLDVLQALQSSQSSVTNLPPASPLQANEVQILQPPRRQQLPQGYQQIPPMRPQRDPNRAMDIRVKQMEGMNVQQLNKHQATIEVLGSDGKWHEQKGCLDSGATMTVGSVQLHEQFCTQVEFMRKLRDVVLPDGTRVKVLKQARIWLRARHKDGRVNVFPSTKIALVDSPNWEWLLIGWDDLYQVNATPEQALYSSSVPATSSTSTQPAVIQHINQNIENK